MMMQNYPLELSDCEHQYQTGGQTDEFLDSPNGGFPPIFICKTGDEEKVKEKREYTTNKTAVSIKEIMEKRRKIKPFISI